MVRAAMAHLHLMALHPFADGNGRLARILHGLVLHRGGVPGPASVDERFAPATRAGTTRCCRRCWVGATSPGAAPLRGSGTASMPTCSCAGAARRAGDRGPPLVGPGGRHHGSWAARETRGGPRAEPSPTCGPSVVRDGDRRRRRNRQHGPSPDPRCRPCGADRQSATTRYVASDTLRQLTAS